MYGSSETGKCPHCQVTVRFESAKVGGIGISDNTTYKTQNKAYRVHTSTCPNCHDLILCMSDILKDNTTYLLWPRNITRSVPQEVPESIKKDFSEAVATLNISPKASAALSRRCLQSVLKDAGKCKKGNLSDQIDEVMNKLPNYLKEQIDSIRNIGNFSAHPIKSKNSGEIIEVEPGEAEWNLEVLDLLFDFYYVQPGRAQNSRKALNQKLNDAGKKPMK